MKTVLNKIFITLLLLGMTACQPSSNGGHGNKGPSEKLQNSNWCNTQQRCFNEDELLHLKQITHIQFGYSIAPLKNMTLSESDLIRIKAISLNEAYETLYDTSLIEETNEFISKLYNFVYQKE